MLRATFYDCKTHGFTYLYNSLSIIVPTFQVQEASADKVASWLTTLLAKDLLNRSVRHNDILRVCF